MELNMNRQGAESWKPYKSFQINSQKTPIALYNVFVPQWKRTRLKYASQQPGTHTYMKEHKDMGVGRGGLAPPGFWKY